MSDPAWNDGQFYPDSQDAETDDGEPPIEEDDQI